MKAALVSLESISSKMTLQALRKYFEHVDSINLKDIEVSIGIGKLDVFCAGKPMEKYDCIYAKGSFRYAPVLRAMTRALHHSTYMPIQPATFTTGHDKLITHLAFQKHKIPMPATYIAASLESAKKILSEITYPVIMKFPHGTGGKGVMYADSFASASSMLDALTSLRQPFIIQEYIETGGVDVRLIVVGDKVVAAMKRHAEMGEKRANIHAGGKGEALTPDKSMQAIAIETAKSIGAEICAVDILESIKGPLVIEANLSPGLQGITAATGINVADHIAKFLYEKAKSFKDTGKDKSAKKIFKDLEILKAAEEAQQIITNIDFRSDRMLLPKLFTDLTKFMENDEFIVKASKGKLVIEKSNIG